MVQEGFEGGTNYELTFRTVKILGSGSPKFEQLVACFNP